MKKKGIYELSILLVILVSIITYSIVSSNTEKKTKTDSIIGDDQNAILKTSFSAEKYLLYLDASLKLALNDSIESLLHQGYTSDCGKGVMNLQEKDCFPSGEIIEKELSRTLSKNMTSYVRSNRLFPTYFPTAIVKARNKGIEATVVSLPLVLSVGEELPKEFTAPEDTSSGEYSEEEVSLEAELAQKRSYSLTILQSSVIHSLRNTPKYVIIHSTKTASLANALQNLYTHKNSYHYIIDTDGNVYQLLPERVGAKHTECSPFETCKIPLLNSQSIAVAFVHRGGKDILTDEQLVSSQRLLSDILLRYSLKPTDVMFHSDVNNKRDDPGPSLRKETLFERRDDSKTIEPKRKKAVVARYTVSASTKYVFPWSIDAYVKMGEQAKKVVEECSDVLDIGTCAKERGFFANDCQTPAKVQGLMLMLCTFLDNRETHLSITLRQKPLVALNAKIADIKDGIDIIWIPHIDLAYVDVYRDDAPFTTINNRSPWHTVRRENNYKELTKGKYYVLQGVTKSGLKLPLVRLP